MTFAIYDSAQKAVLHTFPTWAEAEAHRIELDIKTAWVQELEPLFTHLEDAVKPPQVEVPVVPAPPVVTPPPANDSPPPAAPEAPAAA